MYICAISTRLQTYISLTVIKKEFLTYDDLICSEYIFCSHDDYVVVEDLYSGFDEDFNYVIVCQHTNYDMPQNDSATYLYIDKDEAFDLAKKLGTTLRQLPEVIGASMSEWRENPCPDPRDVRDCFKELIDKLTYEGCHYRIEKKTHSKR